MSGAEHVLKSCGNGPVHRRDGSAGGIRRLRRRLPGAGLGALAAGGPASAQTLTAAFVEAYRTNPQLLAQRALLRATDEQVPQALANWRPTVAFTG